MVTKQFSKMIWYKLRGFSCATANSLANVRINEMYGNPQKTDLRNYVINETDVVFHSSF